MIRFPFRNPDEKEPPAQIPLGMRLNIRVYTRYGFTGDITQTEKDTYNILMEEFPPVLEKLKKIQEVDIPSIEEELNKLNAPWTPGRLIEK